MERLGTRDYKAILDFLIDLYAPAELDEFPDRVVSGLHKLIPCELATYNEMDPDRHSSKDCGSPAEVMTPVMIDQGWRPVMHEHPVLMHNQRTGDLRAYRISDFCSQREFHDRALYQDFYRKIRVEDGICKGILVRGPLVIGCSVSRDRRTFTRKDCLTLDLIGPHLKQAWRNAELMSRLREQINEVSRHSDGIMLGVVLLKYNGRVAEMNPWVREVLREFFGGASVGPNRLPHLLTRWIRNQKNQFSTNPVPQPREPLVVCRKDSRLVVRLIMESSQDLLFLQAHHPEKERARLKSLPLSPREMEVLAWIAKGRTNEEIAKFLEISPRTVQKHIEHIFTKLGVETRTAAAAFLLR